MTKQGFVNTDKYLRVLDTDNKVIPDVYAAGDIVMYPQKFVNLYMYIYTFKISKL